MLSSRQVDTSSATAAQAEDELKVAGRRRRLLSMALLLSFAAALTWLSFAAPWYSVEIPGQVVMSQSNVPVRIEGFTVSASAFQVVSEGPDSPYCPPPPQMSGVPIPLVAVAASALFALIAAAVRSPLMVGVSLFSAVQGFRQMSLLHTAVVDGPAGCMFGTLSLAYGRTLSVVAVTAVVTLSGLMTWQVFAVRSAEKAERLARGEQVPPSLLELAQSRLIGIAGAVVAESKRR